MNPNYPQVAARAEHRCEYCRAPEIVFNFPFEVEHVIPRSRGGSDDGANLALACRSCNLYKSAQMSQVDPETGQDIALFHPRSQSWEDHFQVDAEQGTIIGRTPSGRVTVAALAMNSPTQTTARRLWIRLNLFTYT